jgi:monoamine oxidase
MPRQSVPLRGWKSLLLLSLTLSQSSPALSAATAEKVDVVVIGAGLSGLTAARDLLAAKKSVVVLEGRDRVGGKVYNYPLKNGGVTEVGAEFVGPTQDKVLQMIKDLGLQTFDTYNEGDSVLWRNDTRLVYTPDPALGGAPPLDQDSLVQIATAQGQLNAWAAEVNTSSPWSHAQAKEWDSQTFAQFLDQAAPLPDAKFTLTTACKAIFAAEPRELSLLYVIAYIASAGNETTTGDLGRLIAVQGGAQQQRVVGGTGLIPQRLAEKVGRQHIKLSAAVKSVTATSAGYIVSSRAGTYLAQSVVVAMAPPLLRTIKFTPALPRARARLNDAMFMPALGKGIGIYKKPFWRSTEKLSAQVISDRGASRVTFDSTPEDGAFGAILGFILGDDMRAVDKLSPAQAQKQVVGDFTRYFGDKAKDVSEFVLVRWDLEEFSKGGPTAAAPPGVLSVVGDALRQKVGGIHFAGTETSEFWTGYMDGAIRSGERVAREIVGR